MTRGSGSYQDYWDEYEERNSDIPAAKPASWVEPTPKPIIFWCATSVCQIRVKSAGLLCTKCQVKPGAYKEPKLPSC